MNLGSYLRVFGSGTTALFLALAVRSEAVAADVAAPLSLVGTPSNFTAFDGPSTPATSSVPVAVQPFATASSACAGCKNTGRFPNHRPCNPRVMSINPDACFGFYHTQWSRWEEVCPIPTPGSAFSIVPAAPPAVVPGKPGGDMTKSPAAPLPRPSPMPSIPKP